jgi:hypothetical protein
MSAGEKKLPHSMLFPDVHNSALFYAEYGIIIAGAVKEDHLWEVCSRSEVQRRPANLREFN